MGIFTFHIAIHMYAHAQFRAAISIRGTQVVWLPLHSQESRLLTNCSFHDSLHQRKGRNFAKGTTNRMPCSAHIHIARCTLHYIGHHNAVPRICALCACVRAGL